MLENTEDFSTDSIKKLEGLCQAVLKKSSKDLTQEELKLLLCMDMTSIPDKLTVSVSDTRQVAAYTPSTYGGEIEVSLEKIKKLILEQTLENTTDADKVLEEYLASKLMLRSFLRFKYDSIESELRDMCRAAQNKDKLPPIGRYAD